MSPFTRAELERRADLIDQEDPVGFSNMVAEYPDLATRLSAMQTEIDVAPTEGPAGPQGDPGKDGRDGVDGKMALLLLCPVRRVIPVKTAEMAKTVPMGEMVPTHGARPEKGDKGDHDKGDQGDPGPKEATPRRDRWSPWRSPAPVARN